MILLIALLIVLLLLIHYHFASSKRGFTGFTGSYEEAAVEFVNPRLIPAIQTVGTTVQVPNSYAW